MEMAGERIFHADVSAFRAFFAGGIDADVADEQIDQAIIVVVKKESAGGVRGQVETRFMRNIFEVAVAIVLEKNVTFVDGSDEEILMTGIVDIAECGGNADAIFQADAGLLRNIFKFSVAQIPPELVTAQLADKVDVVEAVTVDVGHGNAGAMIVVHGHVLTGGVRYGTIAKRDAALFQLIAEMELVEDLELALGFKLRFFARGEGGESHVIFREWHFWRSCILSRERNCQASSSRDQHKRRP
jgi:hypothetical protein